MRSSASGVVRVSFDFAQIDETLQSDWLENLRSIVDNLKSELQLELDKRIPASSEEFVFLGDLSVLSEKIVRLSVPMYFAPPKRLKSDETYRLVESRSDWAEHINKRVSLITSVFNGDRDINGFLKNMGELDGYDEFEHFLIRAGSSGDEHQKLIDHVIAWPETAVYVNLAEDPGVYGVWNLGAQLATSPLLSNANLDDRRAPEHTRTLVDILERHPDVAAVSSFLRVTEIPNRTWYESTDARLMFGDQQTGEYGVEALFKPTRDDVRARNLVHCMPVWRRELHAFYGYFDEKRYGPSADWEYWVRVGAAGERFRFVSQPLGLYLNDPKSYWHRDPHARDNDARIVTRYWDTVKDRIDPPDRKSVV